MCVTVSLSIISVFISYVLRLWLGYILKGSNCLMFLFSAEMTCSACRVGMCLLRVLIAARLTQYSGWETCYQKGQQMQMTGHFIFIYKDDGNCTHLPH